MFVKCVTALDHKGVEKIAQGEKVSSLGTKGSSYLSSL